MAWQFSGRTIIWRGMRAQVTIVALLALPTWAAAQPASLERLRTCLAVEDMTKERLDCFDAFVRPEPRSTTTSPATVADCRFFKEEDQRLRCFNSFVTAPTTAVTRRPTSGPTVAAPAQIPNERFHPCHAMDERTKEQLDCFDALVPPAPRPHFTAQPKSIFECRYFREQDDRLRCYINFAARLFKPARAAPPPSPPHAQLPSATHKPARASRGGCGSRGGAGYRTRSGKCASRRH
jgi:hypothetical protein